MLPDLCSITEQLAQLSQTESTNPAGRPVRVFANAVAGRNMTTRREANMAARPEPHRRRPIAQSVTSHQAEP